MKQSSSKSGFQKNVRAILLTTIVVFVVISLVLIMNVWPTKSIRFVHDGQVEAATTKADTLGEFLTERGITPGPSDHITPSVTTPLADGMHVYYSKAIPVTLDIAGQKKKVTTSLCSVKDILGEQHITLGQLDKVTPALTANVQANDTITITRIEKKVVAEEKTVAFNTKKREDSTLPEGQEKVIQEGQNGTIVDRYEVVYTNGQPTSRKLIDHEVTKDWKDHIVAVGTARPALASRSAEATRRAERIAEEDGSFTPRKTLNVRMTAYSPGSDPEYADTRTGTVATEGRTVAVDPSVVPLGWWVYIEGYGFRKAEDTGGKIKGNRMDLFFASSKEAEDFGVQHRKVYIIGPNKPN
ncbi:3D domain-containing protein [Aneurinibacillus uraniidurans]|uniref:3D domain-containing protein n=1 Tax=Aneurinibacillus uraniidurans TaxID=2966586 RepID=UPI00234A0DC2|nr:3D domain-containing protein [Aneurinibacillus sp. B1]WCN37800.1 G5 domain-containing protein [Aneurinibacillus sp. B1]